jgi:3-dehydroquinate synthase
MTVSVNLGPRSYDIVVSSDALAGCGAFARQRNRGTLAVVVTDEHVARHAGQVLASLESVGYRGVQVTIPAGEEQKALTAVAQLYDHLAGLKADRDALVVAVGGGVIGDLAGFVAATYNRGLPLLMVPTTLLAMVDSSVGGKVGVNHPTGKNLIGAFHQPIGVWIHLSVLSTLPAREYRSGLAEVVKYGVILDAEFFAYLERNADAVLRRDDRVLQNVVARCCRLKGNIVEQDERDETGTRAVLNYGHTFAHAFENVAGYGAWLHGEAVAAGMVCASRLAERHWHLDEKVTQQQVELLQRFHLPTKPDRWPLAPLLAAMGADKKNLAGSLRFVLPRRIGEVSLCDGVPEDAVRTVLEECMRG